MISKPNVFVMQIFQQFLSFLANVAADIFRNLAFNYVNIVTRIECMHALDFDRV